LLAGGKQRFYQGISFRKPFFFLLVDSVFGSLWVAVVCEAAWELAVVEADGVWVSVEGVAGAVSVGAAEVVGVAGVASAADGAAGGGVDSVVAVAAVELAVGSMV